MDIKQWHVDSMGALDLSAIERFEPQLVLLFGSSVHFNSALTQALESLLPMSQIIGCSTAGEIAGIGVHQKTLVVTALRFSHPNFKTHSVALGDMADSYAAGQRLAQGFEHAGLNSVMVFAPGVAINGSALIEGMVAQLPKDVPITGGLAGDDGAFKQTWTLHNGKLSDRQLVAIGFYNDRVQIEHGSSGGWQPFGPARKVTRSEGNVLFELDGEPALEVYKKYLGEYANQLPASGLLFPFEMLGADHTKTGLIRTILGVNDEQGSLILAGDIEQEGFLRLMHASTSALVDGAQAAAEAAHKMQTAPGAKLALLVSCVGRRLVMGDWVDEEVEAVAEVFGQNCTLTGFYSYGEISPFFDSPDCKLHNQTMTITLLTEAPN